MLDQQPEFGLHRLALILKFIYSMVGLLVGGSCIVVGAILSLSGVVGHSTLIASALGAQFNLTDAAPGVVVFIVGIFMVLVTRFKGKFETTRTSSPPPTGAALSTGAQGAPSMSRDGGSSSSTGTSTRHSVEYSETHRGI